MSELSLRSQSVVDQSKVISGLLKVGMGICAVIIVLKVTAGTNKIKFPWGLELSIDYSWVLLAIMTGIHAGLAIFLIHRAAVVSADSQLINERQNIVAKVTAESGFVLAGLDPNVRYASKRMIVRSKWDPSFWVGCAGTVLLIAAVVPWRVEHGSLRWGSVAEMVTLTPLSLVLAAINWCAGASWLVALVVLVTAVNRLARGDSKFLACR